jgi:catechol 2,3-dioxygenase-like lactoylglutathione lyase family enzyme
VRIEHVAYQMKDPAAAAEWYVANLGMKVVRSGGPPGHARFLADSSGATVLEIYSNPKVGVPDYASTDPLLLHVAFLVPDVKAGHDRLIAAGGKREGGVTKTDAGDDMAFVRDPWGFPLQLIKRVRPLSSG